MCLKLIRAAGEDIKAVAVLFSIFEIPRWRLFEGLKLKSPYMSGYKLRILIPKISLMIPIPPETACTTYLGSSNQLRFLLMNIFLIPSLISFHQLSEIFYHNRSLTYLPIITLSQVTHGVHNNQTSHAGFRRCSTTLYTFYVLHFMHIAAVGNNDG